MAWNASTPNIHLTVSGHSGCVAVVACGRYLGASPPWVVRLVCPTNSCGACHSVCPLSNQNRWLLLFCYSLYVDTGSPPGRSLCRNYSSQHLLRHEQVRLGRRRNALVIL